MEHTALRELIAGHALDALEPDEEQLVCEHLLACAPCRADLSSFRATATALAGSAIAPAPPERLRADLLAAAAREPRQRRAPWPQLRLARRGDRRRVFVLGGGLAGALAAAAIAALAVFGWGSSSTPTPRGTLTVSAAGSGSLTVRDLPPAPSGSTYEAWVVVDGQARPAAVFASAGRTTVVPLDRRVPRGTAVAVTLEPAGGSPRPTTAPLMRLQA